MTFGSLTALILFVYICYFMMKKGGGCCGGHNHNENQKRYENKSIPPRTEHHIEQEIVTEKDPVCGMDVNGKSPASEHRGETFHFCSEQCQRLFDLNPHKYANL